VFGVGKDISHASKDDTRLVVVSRLERDDVSAPPQLHGNGMIELTKVNVFPEAVCP